jgi:hypothetical protein
MEQSVQEERARSGIPYTGAEIEALSEEAKRIGSYKTKVASWEEQIKIQ